MNAISGLSGAKNFDAMTGDSEAKTRKSYHSNAVPSDDAKTILRSSLVHAGQVPDDALQALRVIWQGFIEADLKHELSLRLALPYSEMSTGRGTTDASLKESP